jgi:membrane protease YdiL (CAAX protease family)
VSTALEALVVAVSMLAVFGVAMTALNFLAGHGVPGLQVWVEERSPVVYGTTILVFFVVLVSVGRIDVVGLLSPPRLLPAVVALLAAPVIALTMYLLELYLSSRSVVRPAGMIAAPSAHTATLRLTAQPAVWWSLAVVSALVEEFIFRGMLLPALVPAVGVLAAVGVSALVFGLHHVTFGAVSIASKTFGGLLLAGQTLLASSLVPAIAAHLLFQYLVWRRLRRTGALA